MWHIPLPTETTEAEAALPGRRVRCDDNGARRTSALKVASLETIKIMTGLFLAVLFCLIGPTFGQLCDPNKERIDCGNYSTRTSCMHISS